MTTKFLFLSKLFSKNTSTYPGENKFLSCYSNTSWLNNADGNNISLITYDFPKGITERLPAPKLNTPNPSSMLKAISGTYFIYWLHPSKEDWQFIINGTEQYSD
jgi:hypothetical protein